MSGSGEIEAKELMQRTHSSTRFTRSVVAVAASLLLVLGAANPAGAQTRTVFEPVGDAIETTSYGRLAMAMSADGSRMVFGEHRFDRAKVYQLNGGVWEQLGADIDGIAQSDTGSAVAMSADGNRVAVSSPNLDLEIFDPGHVMIFEWDGSAWNQVGDRLEGKRWVDKFGLFSIELSADGSHLVVGTPEDNGAANFESYAQVFDWDGTSWAQVGSDLPAENGGDGAGMSVDISDSGERIIVGSPNNSDGAGHARIFEWDGSDWSQLGANIDGQNAWDFAGWAVSISGDGNRAAVGAPENDDGGDTSGQVRVFEWDGSAWSALGSSIVGWEVSASAGNATALSADGSRIVVGARSSNAAIYDWSGSVWQPVGGFNYGRGKDVAISSTGDRVVLAAPGRTTNSVGMIQLLESTEIDRVLCGGLFVTVNLAYGETPTEGDDVIRGTAGDDEIVSLGGNDTICALQGDDAVDAGEGNDVVFAAGGDDLVLGSFGNDLLIGGPGVDILRGENGSDRLRGGDGDDLLGGDGGRDIMRGGNGHDVLFGGTHDDLMWGNLGRDELHGEGGNDVLRGGAWKDVLRGGAGANDGCTLKDPGGLIETRIECEAGVFGR